MNVRKISEWVLLGCVLVILVWDIIAGISGVHHGSISGVIWDISKKYPIVPFVSGFLMGHLFWQETKE